MLRTVYNTLLHLALPLIPVRLWWRGRREPGYRTHVGERFGAYARRPDGPVIWVHAVSVGESRAAQPLVDALASRFPDHALLLTTMTATGRATAESLYADRAMIVFLPYDYPWAARRFLAHFRPRFGIIMETEIWPNLVRGARQQGIPMVLANARMSPKSARGYGRVAALAREALADITAIGAQSEADAQRLRDLGAHSVEVTGNLKFDITPPPETRERAGALRSLWGERPVFLAASTREGEEELLLDALSCKAIGGLLTVIVPRHPQRFDEVAALLTRRGLSFARRSANVPVPADCPFALGDTMGEMFAYYGAADVAWVGGSLLPYGAQNLIEACAMGTPVIIGPSTYNFAQATELAIETGAAVQAANADGVMAEVARLVADPAARRRMGEAGAAFTVAHQGATARTMRIVERVVGET
ncbi:MAG: lipid IV(A) 3-deoxy-D-manno-octulosonic acid transferase [Betaproteobacteria bacterium]|nr:lipid IV(A) 3-deoxy-D-manno-octulosonic acid transferase [Betaproteobacteria bacterium]